ncbi:putative histone-binding protein Caf1 [Choanephora cucurbitarum]|uniref:Putative histone-binding protein Caf1 n=1 Tax=Choanephora cucurbitarum TaxID=101091 RepID=A0A1C7N1V0_9FUNG|nr:putative histone-binding protein Caf1 [Choanephora cucurbitarum]
MELEHQQSQEEQLIQEEYTLWKKNAPFLYDTIITHGLEWPSLTCQWFPDVESRPDKNYKTQRLLLGTHTNDEEPNYLLIASVQLPSNTHDIDLRKYEETTNEIGGYGAFNDAHIQVQQKIVHEGEVNRARYQYENPNVIATKSRSGEVYVFDRTTHGSIPRENEPFHPALCLKGHHAEGYGLAWNPHKAKSTHILSSGSDRLICHWDIAAASKEHRHLDPLRTYRGHEAGVMDIAWHMKHDTIFASCGDDQRLMIWDTRDHDPIQSVQAHTSEINCVGFSPGNEWILATGSSDKTAALWDLRNLNHRLHTFQSHKEEVVQLAWSPHHDAILATASNDRRICVWDLARIGDELSTEEAQYGPPELMFIHGGHSGIISDFGWNPAVPWMMASTAEDNQVQTWQIASTIYGQEEQEESDKMEFTH